MNKNLPKCIIVDMDGTLAKRKKGKKERSPFDWQRVGEDNPNWPVIKVVQLFKKSGYSIIILSGRDMQACEATGAWLYRYEIHYDKLFMRPSGDNQKDFTLKCKMYISHIVGKYDVEFVLDDRDQVVALWRKFFGLPCFQVDYGNF